MERGWPGGPGKRGRFLWWEIEERRGKENASVCMLSPSLLRLETSTVAYQSLGQRLEATIDNHDGLLWSPSVVLSVRISMYLRVNTYQSIRELLVSILSVLPFVFRNWDTPSSWCLYFFKNISVLRTQYILDTTDSNHGTVNTSWTQVHIIENKEKFEPHQY